MYRQIGSHLSLIQKITEWRPVDSRSTVGISDDEATRRNGDVVYTPCEYGSTSGGAR